MFTAIQFKKLMDVQPFKPFRVHMSDGNVYEVPNHDAAFVKRNAIQIGLDLDSEGLASRFVDCAIIHVTRIEELQAA